MDLNTGLEDSGMLKQISFMSNEDLPALLRSFARETPPELKQEEKSGLSLSSHSPGFETCDALRKIVSKTE